VYTEAGRQSEAVSSELEGSSAVFAEVVMSKRVNPKLYYKYPSQAESSPGWRYWLWDTTEKRMRVGKSAKCWVWHCAGDYVAMSKMLTKIGRSHMEPHWETR
jgi:hypothetical protein